MLISGILASVLLLPQSASPYSAEVRARIVTKEVVLAVPHWGGADFLWQFNHSLGDLDADGFSDNILFGLNVESPTGPPQSGRELSVLMAGALGRVSTSFDQSWLHHQQKYILNPTSWKTPITAVIRSPSGMLVVGLERSPERYTVRELEGGRLVGTFVAPAPPPGLPPIFSIRGIFRAPDINLDGWEEIFYQATADEFAVCGLIDGQALTGLWARYEPWYGSFAPIFMPDYGRRGDLDGDTVPDFLFGYARRVPPPSPWYMRVVAVSGLTGDRIWATQFTEYPNTGFGGVDFTGDGVEDVIATSTDQIVALDGTDGSIVWTRSAREFDHLLEGSYGYIPYFVEMNLMTRWPGRADEPVGLAGIRHGQQGTSADYHYYIVLDMRTGALVHAQYSPETLAPWTPEEVDVTNGYSHHFCGDMDGDGYQEFARVIPAPLWDNPSTSWPARHLVYFGPETLFLDQSAEIGQSLRGSVSLPAAAGCDYRMIASLDFDPELGVLHDGFPTHLVRDRVFNHFLARGDVRGVLDADGAAAFDLHVPDDPSLRGRTLHLRILATQPGEPWRLKTMSTVASVRIRG
jgi:hypothetical protein